MLIIHAPNTFRPERTWILNEIIVRITSEFRIQFEEREDYCIAALNSTKKIILKDFLIPALSCNKDIVITETGWVQLSNLCKGKLPFCDLPVFSIKGFEYADYISMNDLRLEINIDIFGMLFWSLARHEELRSDVILDERGRYSSKNSYLVKNNLHLRPWVDEWVLWLGSCIKTFFSLDFKEKPKKPQLLLSHDVDIPYAYAYASWYEIPRKIASKWIVARERNPLALAKVPFNWFLVKYFNQDKLDPNHTFTWIMDQAEKIGVQSQFNFICGNSSKYYDARYKITDARIKRLILAIHNRGHLIGLHPSYESYLNLNIMQSELDNIKNLWKMLGLSEKISWSSRQHYLRFKFPDTAINLARSGIAVDTSLGFADQVGFRCGTSYEYELFDVGSRQKLGILEQPLIVMDSSLLSKQYMGMRLSTDLVALVRGLRKKCEDVGGNFTMLWHNNNLVSAIQRDIYRQIIA